jgi:adenylosuccinate synthase
VDRIALTKPDVLEEFSEVLVCTGYRYKGEVLKAFPSEPWILEKVTPVWRTLAGWRNSVHGASDAAALPRSFRDYVRFLEDLVETRVAIISTGVEREETVFVPGGLRGLVDLRKLRRGRPA